MFRSERVEDEDDDRKLVICDLTTDLLIAED